MKAAPFGVVFILRLACDFLVRGVVIINRRERLIHIHACRGISWLMVKKFIAFDPSLKQIYKLSRNDFKSIFTMKESAIDLFMKDLHCERTIFHLIAHNNIGTLTIFDHNYPYLLKQTYDPPWVLYYKGDLSILNIENKISVVGSRNPSNNGILSLNKIVTPLITKGWVIVSGLAVGIDGRAHSLAINHHGKTISVLGSGFNFIYPQCHQKLASIISEHHLLLSEYPPNEKPQKWNFPMRNRIISGLTKGTIIIEARKKSGSLITADLALQQGREVFAVPGSILDERNEGTHTLIQQGAKLTNSCDDVLNEL